MKRILSSLAAVIALTAAAAEPGRPQIVSPEVHADRTVTFRLQAPKAAQVVLNGEIGRTQPMTRDGNGLWSATVGPLEPDIYSYLFNVDGVPTVDPRNSLVKTGRSTENLVEVPGPAPRFYEAQAVPHGAVTVQWYPSKPLGGLRRMHVYTPPGYDRDPGAKFPVLYLLHGSGDDDSGWTWIGRANFIADNLIAAGRARPMIIVMPMGHALPPAAPGEGRQRWAQNTSAFEKDLLDGIVPFVERHYRIQTDAAHQAIAGLSMGGGQALAIGLTHLDRFAWVGGFSSGGGNLAGENDPRLANPQETNRKLSLLWIACGRQDFLFKTNQQFDQTLTRSGIAHEFHVTEGTHTWRLWRPNLRDLLQRLFQNPPASRKG